MEIKREKGLTGSGAAVVTSVDDGRWERSDIEKSESC